MPWNWRRLIFGAPFATLHAQHTRLSNVLALPVFASDALSSVSYATEETPLVLVVAGAGQASLGVSWPIGLAIAAVLAIVVASYRLTVRAYPQGGGDYRVSQENLGTVAGLTVASALLLDYILTVAVSISAGVATITSAVPALHGHQVPLAVGLIVFIGLANLRGAKESGVMFAIPTYLFIASILTLLGVGFARITLGHELAPPQPPPDIWADTGQSLTLFLILRAFTSGCTALTGVVAGVHRGMMPAVKYVRKMAEDMRAVYVELDPSKTPEVLRRWHLYVPDVPLVVLESPYRSLLEPLLKYIDQVEAERVDDVVTVVIPEFVTEKWWTKLLHGQNGLLLKWALLFRRNVVVINIRYYLDTSGSTEDTHPLTSRLEKDAT